jgi:sugar-specific transcriptional regulator TrmB
MLPKSELQFLGLNDKQATVYMSAFELGQSTVLELSKHSRIKRSTVYVILDELKYKKLAHEITKGHTTLFYAEHPATLGKQLEEQLTTFKNLQPLLVDLYNKETSKPNVKFYSTKEDVEQLYINIMEQHTSIDFFGTDLEGFAHSYPNLFQKVDDYIHDGKHFVREIDTHSAFNIRYAKKNYHPRFHKIRIIDQEYTFFGDNALYGNSLMISSPSEHFAVTIESKDVFRTFKTLFEVAWSVSKPPRDLRKK